MEQAYQDCREEKGEWARAKQGPPPCEIFWKGRALFESFSKEVQDMLEEINKKSVTELSQEQLQNKKDLGLYLQWMDMTIRELGKQEGALFVKSLRTKQTFQGRKKGSARKGEVRLTIGIADWPMLTQEASSSSRQQQTPQQKLVQTSLILFNVFRILGHDTRTGTSPISPLETSQQKVLNESGKKNRRRRKAGGGKDSDTE
eukprot:TRINITY_DN26228_c0_g1_i1.p1 TRINITY_DN26228_c0_g1~~TRINITY_DN26228_c0_g1_i1.p1  ORF type:complete len:234 (-),score=58.16 TRINITY_DN26228_c0_g1_i1:8-613(-)